MDETKPEDIATVVEAMEPKPRVITATITKVSIEEVQRALRRLPIVTICVDEAQVAWMMAEIEDNYQFSINSSIIGHQHRHAPGLDRLFTIWVCIDSKILHCYRI